MAQSRCNCDTRSAARNLLCSGPSRRPGKTSWHAEWAHRNHKRPEPLLHERGNKKKKGRATRGTQTNAALGRQHSHHRPVPNIKNQQHFAGARIGGELTHATEARRLSRCNFTCRVKEPKGRASDAEPKDLLERFLPSKREGKNSRARDVVRADRRLKR